MLQEYDCFNWLYVGAYLRKLHEILSALPSLRFPILFGFVESKHLPNSPLFCVHFARRKDSLETFACLIIGRAETSLVFPLINHLHFLQKRYRFAKTNQVCLVQALQDQNVIWRLLGFSFLFKHFSLLNSACSGPVKHSITFHFSSVTPLLWTEPKPLEVRGEAVRETTWKMEIRIKFGKEGNSPWLYHLD